MTPVKPLDWLRAAIDDDRLTTTERAAVAGVARCAPGKSQRDRFAGQTSGWDFYLSRDKLAGLMGASIPTAQRALLRLHQLGFLEKVAQGGRRGIRTVSTVWRLAIPNASPVTSWEASQRITGDLLEEPPNVSETEFPTYQEGASQHITGDTPREHRIQESAVLQESTANAQPLTRLLVDENHSNSESGTGPTEDQKVTTDRAPVELWGQPVGATDAWIS